MENKQTENKSVSTMERVKQVFAQNERVLDNANRAVLQAEKRMGVIFAAPKNANDVIEKKIS